MKNQKRRFPAGWAMAVIMMLAVFLPVSMVYTAEIDATTLTDLKLTVKQNGSTIPDGGTLTSTQPIRLDVSFGVPVEGDDPTPDSPVQKGDSVKFELSSAFSLISGGSVELKMGTLLVGHVSFTTDPDTKMVTANVLFDGEDSVFDGTSNTVTCQFGADFEYDASGSGGSTGNHTVSILEKTFTVNVPAQSIIYEVTKTGAVNLADQSIEWTVNVGATQGGEPVSLAGYQFFDNLQTVGTYIASSFQVDGAATAPETTGNALSYVFPEDSASPKVITFRTKIPDTSYYAATEQKVHNLAQLLDSESTEAGAGEFEVTFTPQWIEKTGVADDQGTGTYDPTNRTITWTITANQMGAALNNVVITDVLPAGLTLGSANWQTWNGSAWNSATSITPGASGEYALGNISSQILLTLVTNVPDDAYTTGKTTYSNSASIRWEGLTGPAPGTGNIDVGIGFNAITKSGVADAANQKIRWTVSVNTKGQTIPALKVLDLLVYGKSLDLSTVTGIPGAIASADLTPRYGQKYAGSFSGSGTVTVNVIPIEQDGVRVADLLEITGFSATDLNTFAFDSQVVDPDIYAGNKTSEVRNTATLFSAGTKLNFASGSVDYPNKMLLKEMLKREAMSDPAAGVNSSITGDAADGFDYLDKSVIFRLSVNADGLDLTNMANAAGQTLGTATLTDTLPEGWEFVDIVSGSKHLIFEGIRQPNGTISATDTTPDTVAGLSASFDGRTATFTFTTLSKPYVILLKARPTSETAAQYFSVNQTETQRNNVTLKTANWNTGVSSYQDVTIFSQILEKNTSQPKAGELRWTVNYQPYNLPHPGERLEDQLPVGLDLRTDASGALLLTDGNITAHELNLNADGSYTVGTEIELNIGGNLAYNNETRVLSFTIPNNTKAYRLSYITDITGEPGTVTNKVSLFGGGTEQEETAKPYVISTLDGSASLQRNGWISIVKTNQTGNPLSGAEFTLYALDGATIIKKGVTGSDGTLRFKVIPDGKYLLRETAAPAGYTREDATHSLTVTTNGLSVSASIDGQTGANSNTLTVKNFIEGTAGNLTISKVVAGNNADTSKLFDFTLNLDGADGTYPYIGQGVPNGTIKSGDKISLAHGQSITVMGLPKGIAYTVTEADYLGDRYRPTSLGATGRIVADTTQIASFTNTRNTSSPGSNNRSGNLTISKTVAGIGADPAKKFNFTVTFEEAPGAYHYTGNGVPSGTIKSGGTISLAHGESITIIDLPSGAKYQVSEDTGSAQGYAVSSAESSGTISAAQDRTAAFTNTKLPDSAGSTGNLTISKTVTGSGADLNKKFSFTITFVDAPDAYPYTGASAGVIRSGDSILLANGESITITGLPTGTKYTVTEADYTEAGYSASSTGSIGVISAKALPVASFTNNWSKAIEEPKPTEKPTDKIEGGAEAGDADKPPGSIESNESSLPKTGDDQAGDFAKQGLLILSLVFVALFTTNLVLRKKES